MKKSDRENGSVGKDTQEAVKFPIANQPGCSSEKALEKQKIEKG